ncbi:DEAD/DEAH box helicase [Terrabacter sp. 2YAF2]|uniref:DEAD/DEAH box helicase n=1 Tax=Terrabacter sp. 2YAF2 TaxID=3233026 RepID=UPI003F97497A
MHDSDTDSKAWRTDGDQVLLRVGGSWRTATAQEVTAAISGPGRLGLRRETGLRFGKITLRPQVAILGDLPDGARIATGVIRGAGLIRIPDLERGFTIHEGTWHALDSEAVAACNNFLTRHALEEGQKITLGAYLELKADPKGVNLLHDVTEWPPSATARAGTDFSSMGLVAQLYPYQQTGADFLVEMARRGVGVLLADQMGLGKTIQAIALLLAEQSNGPCLVVCPASLLHNWSRELGTFAPHLSSLQHSGPARTGVAGGFAGYDIVLTTYDTLVNDLSFMGGLQWNIVVLDEAQYIRNPDTARSDSIKSLQRRISIALTGTPIENRLLDSWSIAEFVVPALLGSRQGFEEAFPDEFARAHEVGRLLGPVTLRRLVDEVAKDLPELIQVETAFELTPNDRARYQEIAATAANPLSATTSLRILCAHADRAGREAGASPKVDHTLRLLNEAFEEQQKALVFASFQTTLDLLLDAIRDQQEAAFISIIDGRTSTPSRQEIIDQFCKFPGPGVLLMNPRAAGVGLNITAANHVIHFNPEWNPALTSQATARAYRRKQHLPVTVHHLFYEGTVEEEALDKAEWKRGLAQNFDSGTTEEGS